MNIRSIIKKIKTGLSIITGWCFFVPISFIIPKKKNLIVIIGSENGYFRDNSKYFYIEASGYKDLSAIFLTQIKDEYKLLKKNKIGVIYYPSIKGIWLLLRANFIVVDDHHWFKDFKFYIGFFSKKIQLWHGTGIKYVELMNRNEGYWTSKRRKIISIVSGRFPLYDLIAAPSDYFKEIFYKKSFRAKKIAVTGYPRNDILARKHFSFTELVGTDVKIIEKMKIEVENGKKLIIYMPTFRDKAGESFILNSIDLKKLEEFLTRENSIFILKLHYYLNSGMIKESKNIIQYDSKLDIYPLLLLSNVLVTDYSSVFFDYLFLNRPIVFYVFDVDYYRKNDRGFYLDIEEIAPGPVVKDFQELLNELSKALKNNNYFALERQMLLRKAFKFVDDKASDRIILELQKLWNKS